MAKKFEMAGSKALVVILAAVLILGGIVGSTMAWLMAETDDVVNTFTYGDINIDLEETDTELDEDDDPNTNEFEMIPGQEIEKDPTVTVLKDSENAWVFVKLVESENFDEFLTYGMAEGWAALLDAEGNAVEGVYYRYQGESAEDVEIEVLNGNKVIVRPEVTKEMLNALNAGDTENYPTLTVTAYAVQYAGFEAKNAETGEITHEPTQAENDAAALNAWNTVVMADVTNP